MKITSVRLKKIIKEEIENTLAEAREDHIDGIIAKIDRLEKAFDDVNRSMANDREAAGGDDDILRDIISQNSYFAKQTERSNLDDKITLLTKQLNQLQNAPEGKGNVGQLERD